MAFFQVPVDVRSGVALETGPVMKNQTTEAAHGNQWSERHKQS